jgi:hypothetical protein
MEKVRYCEGWQPEEGENTYGIEVRLTFSCLESGVDKAEAIKRLKDNFVDEFDVYLTDEEIVKVEEL